MMHADAWRSKIDQLDIRPWARQGLTQDRLAQGGHAKQNPERAQYHTAEVFAEAARTGRTALWHPRQYAAGLLLIDHITGMVITA